MPKRIFDVDIYPYGGYDEEREKSISSGVLKKVLELADQLHFKAAELIAVSAQNRYRYLIYGVLQVTASSVFPVCFFETVFLCYFLI